MNEGQITQKSRTTSKKVIRKSKSYERVKKESKSHKKVKKSQKKSKSLVHFFFGVIYPLTMKLLSFIFTKKYLHIFDDLGVLKPVDEQKMLWQKIQKDYFHIPG